MGESYMYQRLPYARGEGEGEDEEERGRSAEGQMVKSEVVDRCVSASLSVITVCLCQVCVSVHV